jgi:uncharacterized protein YdeI (YjbR/CyaY-like superfamily)
VCCETPAIEPRFFASLDDFRAWLEKHHATETEILVGFHKKQTGRPTMTWTESVREALCFGWIDGIRRSLGDDSYTIRFTPRKRGSNWSAVNLRHVEELMREGRMAPAGIAAFEARKPERTGVYSFEQRHAARLEPEHEKRFRPKRKRGSSSRRSRPATGRPRSSGSSARNARRRALGGSPH